MTVQAIVVGVDASPGSAAAVAWAVDIAKATSARVVAVHALGLLERLSPDAEPFPSEPYRDAIRHRFEHEWCAALHRAGVPSRCVMLDGPPAMVLREVAEAEAADLIVVGRRARTTGTMTTLGSTSLELANSSPIPVTVIP